jgi:phage terminase large subunit GpA-like protein
MNNWWKSPVLQGPENDYGDYDYLIEDIPSNSSKWDWWHQKCSECGKEHYLNINYTAYFRTMDGWDSMDSCECWKCYLKRKIKAPFRTIKKTIKCFIEAEKEYCNMKKILKENNLTLTKELKKQLRKITNHNKEIILQRR